MARYLPPGAPCRVTTCTAPAIGKEAGPRLCKTHRGRWYLRGKPALDGLTPQAIDDLLVNRSPAGVASAKAAAALAAEKPSSGGGASATVSIDKLRVTHRGTTPAKPRATRRQAAAPLPVVPAPIHAADPQPSLQIPLRRLMLNRSVPDFAVLIGDLGPLKVVCDLNGKPVAIWAADLTEIWSAA